MKKEIGMVESDKVTLAVVAREIRRFINRRARIAGDELQRFAAMLVEDPVDAMVHSRGAIVAGARKSVYANAEKHFADAEAIASDIANGADLDAEARAAIAVAGLQSLQSVMRATLYRVARDLASEHDGHRIVVQGARCAALAEVLETLDDELVSAGLTLTEGK